MPAMQNVEHAIGEHNFFGNTATRGQFAGGTELDSNAGSCPHSNGRNRCAPTQAAAESRRAQVAIISLRNRFKSVTDSNVRSNSEESCFKMPLATRDSHLVESDFACPANAPAIPDRASSTAPCPAETVPCSHAGWSGAKGLPDFPEEAISTPILANATLASLPIFSTARFM